MPTLLVWGPPFEDHCSGALRSGVWERRSWTLAEEGELVGGHPWSQVGVGSSWLHGNEHLSISSHLAPVAWPDVVGSPHPQGLELQRCQEVGGAGDHRCSRGEGFSQNWGLSIYHLHRMDPHVILEQRWPGHFQTAPCRKRGSEKRTGLLKVTQLGQDTQKKALPTMAPLLM